MHVPELSSNNRTELKRLMDRISRAATDIKRAAHTFTIRDVTHKQMEEIMSFTAEAAVLMASLKPQPEKEDCIQPLLDFAMALPGLEEDSTSTEEKQLVIDLALSPNGEFPHFDPLSADGSSL